MKRYVNNPIIAREDVPEIKPQLVDVTSVFNPGAIKYRDEFLLMLRVQNRGRETYLLTAQSDNGIGFALSKTIVEFSGLEDVSETIYHIYDPRLTAIDDTYYIMFAMDMDSGCNLGLARTTDFKSYRFMGIIASGDIRNGVLFPEKINDKYIRLDRPNNKPLAGGSTSGSSIYLSESDDLINWRTVCPLMSGRPHFWDELIGSGPPPIKTREGWLHIYHGIATHFGSTNIYQAGVVLLDLDNPEKIIARGKYNILEPREPYELVGQVPNVVFPSGMIVKDLEPDGTAKSDSELFLYYGAADTSVGLAIATVSELIDACHEGNESDRE
ncbi:MAG: glycosidase [candidate division Zixibacteria bacterium]|nr:glycosidase [candidate division Zixibacteria bacterium]